MRELWHIKLLSSLLHVKLYLTLFLHYCYRYGTPVPLFIPGHLSGAPSLSIWSSDKDASCLQQEVSSNAWGGRYSFGLRRCHVIWSVKFAWALHMEREGLPRGFATCRCPRCWHLGKGICPRCRRGKGGMVDNRKLWESLSFCRRNVEGTGASVICSLPSLTPSPGKARQGFGSPGDKQ